MIERYLGYQSYHNKNKEQRKISSRMFTRRVQSEKRQSALIEEKNTSAQLRIGRSFASHCIGRNIGQDGGRACAFRP